MGLLSPLRAGRNWINSFEHSKRVDQFLNLSRSKPLREVTHYVSSSKRVELPGGGEGKACAASVPVKIAIGFGLITNSSTNTMLVV